MSLSEENRRICTERGFILNAQPFREWSDLIDGLMNAARTEPPALEGDEAEVVAGLRWGSGEPISPAAAKAIALITSLTGQKAALRAEVERLRNEIEATRFLITGGEDAPGHIASLPFSEIERVAEENLASWRHEVDRAEAAESRASDLERQVAEPWPRHADPSDWEYILALLNSAVRHEEDAQTKFWIAALEDRRAASLTGEA